MRRILRKQGRSFPGSCEYSSNSRVALPSQNCQYSAQAAIYSMTQLLLQVWAMLIEGIVKSWGLERLQHPTVYEVVASSEQFATISPALLLFVSWRADEDSAAVNISPRESWRNQRQTLVSLLPRDMRLRALRVCFLEPWIMSHPRRAGFKGFANIDLIWQNYVTRSMNRWANRLKHVS